MALMKMLFKAASFRMLRQEASSSAAVRAHEQEHVNNAYDKAQKGNGKGLYRYRYL